MSNKEIQEQRMRGYFIQATKDIIKSEGIKCVSVRNIANQAGYSYATLYHYFKDVKDLIFECVVDFQEECQEFISQKTAKTPMGLERIRVTMQSFIEYFLEYPGIFDLFYVEKTSEIVNTKNTTELIYSFPERLCNNDWEYCRTNQLFSDEQITSLKHQLNYQAVGMLLFYMNRRQPNEYTTFMQLAQKQIDHILK